jgi:hypothetical protein
MQFDQMSGVVLVKKIKTNSDRHRRQHCRFIGDQG